MSRGSSAGNSDDVMPGVPPWVIGVVAGISAWAGIGLLVQGVGAVFWVLARVISGNDDPISTWPIWLTISVGVVLYLFITLAAIDAGRRTARWVAERRGGPTRQGRSTAGD